ncbi:3-oxoacyl-(acyl-carrier-protein) reductase [Pyrenophora tritici-repentis Pt-1C-BFP]|uniref:3-oxoacyl-(Acyl-carrier-protein) reductase n=1 Tax=Pyrenophora tritici-repentis (strain Pt-1C-BFP) TaxID=426418 RepID=B2W427_PYRTR|nr:3-oxoacyl-(acyl-carrier-protein) reductase [Pyrenophora tritici-repentis Pt-1C-BFP]EDU48134.1 3-oxoacyl-(acyl-carrier-protein) reductase [Pyrenophora tritici-repentis Pt-1C-BFP]
MPTRLQSKIAIITGSSSGLGRAIALAFALEGATIICADLRPEARPCPSLSPTISTSAPLLPTHDLLAAQGFTAIFITCDTTSSTSIQHLIATTVSTYGRLDIMVNNAGVGLEGEGEGEKPVWEYDEHVFERTMEVNIKGVFLGTKYASRQMVKQDPVGEGEGGITKSAALDCAPHNIHVNALCPGYTATAITARVFEPQAAEVKKVVDSRHPLKGMGAPEDVARAAVFLASEDAAWVTGVGLPVDGGYSCV